jgi:hypothetical protein
MTDVGQERVPPEMRVTLAWQLFIFKFSIRMMNSGHLPIDTYIVPLSGIQFSAPFFHFIVVIAIIFF